MEQKHWLFGLRRQPAMLPGKYLYQNNLVTKSHNCTLVLLQANSFKWNQKSTLLWMTKSWVLIRTSLRIQECTLKIQKANHGAWFRVILLKCATLICHTCFWHQYFETVIFNIFHWQFNNKYNLKKAKNGWFRHQMKETAILKAEPLLFWDGKPTMHSRQWKPSCA